MITAKVTKRIKVISIEGRVEERYFDVTSEVPRKIVESRISAMPFKGRSVRAGARRRLADFCSGRGKETLSSLAAAAGGGVTFGTQARKGDTNQLPADKNANRRATATP